MQYEVEVGGTVRRVIVHRTDGGFVVSIDERDEPVDAVRVDAHTWSLLVDGRSYEVTVAPDGTPGVFAVGVGSTRVAVALNARLRRRRREDGSAGDGAGRIVAPMPGKIVRVLVAPGDVVRPRQPLVVIEAMKMENELRAAASGRVADVHASVGQSVDAGALLVVLAGAD